MEHFRAALFVAAFTACNAPERGLPDAGPEKAAEFRGIATAPSSATQSSSGAPRAVMPFSAADRARMQAVVDSPGDAGGMSPAAQYLVRQIPRGLPTDADLSALLDICESRGDRDCELMARAEQERRRQAESTYHPGLTPSAAVDSGHSN